MIKRFVSSLAVLVALSINTAFAVGPVTSDPVQQLDGFEKLYFQHDFTRETVEQRLARMEKFVFGQTYTGTIDQRVARIARVSKTAKASVPDEDESPAPRASSPAPSVPSPPANQDDGSSGDYPHVTYLEREILGQSFEGQSLTARLERLETKAFGHVSRIQDLSSRTDLLEQYAELRLHKHPFAVQPDPEGTSESPDIIRANFARQEQNMEASAETPPEAHARMLARIAWCEQHTFGRTFPELHLLERLHQLNSHLFPQDREKDIQLMDRVDTIMKKVVMLQHPHQAS